VQRYAPELQRRLRSRLNSTNDSWRVDETYIRVKGKWVYLYRAVDSTGATIDFLLSAKRDAAAAERFLAKALGRANQSISEQAREGHILDALPVTTGTRARRPEPEVQDGKCLQDERMGGWPDLGFHSKLRPDGGRTYRPNSLRLRHSSHLRELEVRQLKASCRFTYGSPSTGPRISAGW
jgi:DDE domain